MEKTGYLIFVLVLILVLVLSFVTPMGDAEGYRNPDERERRCGVGLPRCQGELRCINGFCKSDRAPRLPYYSDLPLAPTAE